MAAETVRGPLSDMKVLELGDHSGEFCGRLLAGAGADVIRVEPPEGASSRRIGPFQDDEPGVDRSLFYWHYNLGKRGITLDLEDEDGRQLLLRLAEQADIVIESGPPGRLEALGLGYEALSERNSGLIGCAISPFGQWGPQRDYQASELVHLALGGQMMVCGYDPVGDYDPDDPAPNYDTPPIAPQMWHPYHVAGIQAAIAIFGAVVWRMSTGEGQFIDLSIHEALAGCTEMAVPMWIYERFRMYRQTSRHAWPRISQPAIHMAGDGNWILAKPAMGFARSWDRFVAMLAEAGMEQDLADERYRDVGFRSSPEAATHINEVLENFLLGAESSEVAMEAAQAVGLPWAAVRRPEENAADEHWAERGLFAEIEHPELGRSFTYVARPWVSETLPWTVGERAPLLGEHNVEVYGELLGITDEELAAMPAARREG